MPAQTGSFLAQPGLAQGSSPNKICLEKKCKRSLPFRQNRSRESATTFNKIATKVLPKKGAQW